MKECEDCGKKWEVSVFTDYYSGVSFTCDNCPKEKKVKQ